MTKITKLSLALALSAGVIGAAGRGSRGDERRAGGGDSGPGG